MTLDDFYELVTLKQILTPAESRSLIQLAHLEREGGLTPMECRELSALRTKIEQGRARG